MRVFISADIEGVTGVVSWAQAGRPSGEHFDWPFARRMMTHDVNAAIRGARAGGAETVVVKDSHGFSRNLLIDELEPGVELVSGTHPHSDGMMTGCGEGFDCAMLVGYHGMAGTLNGVMEHTISGAVHRFWINGALSGEIALSAATAGYFGVPLVFVSSDDKGCAEAKALLAHVETACVKVGMGRYMARLSHPSVTGPLIEATAKSAVSGAKSVTPWTATSPVTVKLEFNNSEQADMVSLIPEWSRLDAFTLQATLSDWPQAHRLVRRAIAHASLGAGGNQ